MKKFENLGKKLSNQEQKNVVGGTYPTGGRCDVRIQGGTNQGDYQFYPVSSVCSEMLSEAAQFGNAQTSSGTNGCVDSVTCTGCAA